LEEGSKVLSFEKRLRLPHTSGLTASDVQATYLNGLLRLTVPKPGTIKVTQGGQSIEIKDA